MTRKSRRCLKASTLEHFFPSIQSNDPFRVGRACCSLPDWTRICCCFCFLLKKNLNQIFVFHLVKIKFHLIFFLLFVSVEYIIVNLLLDVFRLDHEKESGGGMGRDQKNCYLNKCVILLNFWKFMKIYYCLSIGVFQFFLVPSPSLGGKKPHQWRLCSIYVM